MGDLFHQTNANQTANNSQVGVSNRDVGGSVITIGSGVGSNGGHVNIQTLDPLALNVAASAVHDALAANTATNVSAFQAFQQALTSSGETAASALQVASSGAGSGAAITSTTAGTMFNPSTLIWAGVAIVGIVLIVGLIRK